MNRTVEVNRRDICPGDIPRTAEYELDDNMTIPQFLQFIAEHFLWDVLHYQWRIVASDYDHPLGFIARRKPDAQVNLKGPSEVVSYLSQQLDRNDLVECCVPPELTIKDLDVTSVACVDEN